MMCGPPREQCDGFIDLKEKQTKPPEPLTAEDRYMTEWMSDNRWFEED